MFWPQEPYKSLSNNTLKLQLLPHNKHRIQYNRYYVYVVREIISVMRQNSSEHINKWGKIS
jgi:hypothetical protein